MKTHVQIPVIFMAFANERSNDARYLRNLPDEQRRVRAALQPAEARGLCEVVIISNTTHKDILDVFQDPRYRNRIAIFHFGGHGGGRQIMLENVQGSRSDMYAGGLAQLLGEQRGLELVFLNGCSTGPQTEGLQKAGVPAIISTSQSIDDAMATMFSSRFYKALASGTTLGTAYRESEGAVRSMFGDKTHRVYRDLEEEEDEEGGLKDALAWPWGLHINAGAEEVESWSLATAVGDHLFGLPDLPRYDLPPTPFKGLDWFHEEDAEIFFGRGRMIRRIYDLLTDDNSEPIALLYGPTGAGKSSLLGAGLFPRLKALHEVRYVRRDPTSGLTGALDDAFPGMPTAQNWIAEEKAAGDRPLMVILDQVEEVFTRANPAHPEEFEDFLRVLVELFSTREARPKGRLLLSFRKEWLAEIETALIHHRLPFSKISLDLLSRDEIIEIIGGPSHTQRLRDKYHLQIEDALSVVVADDLLEDRTAALAPTLQILLSRLWERAVALDPEGPKFTVAVYQEMKKEGLLLDDVIERQFKALAAWRPDVLDSGLALDILARHTTSLGTADGVSREALLFDYRHRSDVMTELLQRFADGYLLVELQQKRAGGGMESQTRLAHDTLAPLVRHRFEESANAGQRSARILHQRVKEWRDGAEGNALDAQDLAVVEAGGHGTAAWDADELRLIRASRVSRDAHIKARKMARFGAVAAVVFVAISAILAWIFYADAQILTKEAIKAKEDATHQAARVKLALRTSRAQATLFSFDGETRLGRHRLASLLAIQAHHLFKDPPPAIYIRIVQTLRQTLRPEFHADTLGRCDEAPTKLAISHDGKHLAAGCADAVHLWTLEDSGEASFFRGHQGKVEALAFSPNSKWFASADSAGVMRLWEIDKPGLDPVSLGRHSQKPTSTTFSPDGRWLALLGEDGDIKVWRVDARDQPPRTLKGGPHKARDLVFSPDGQHLETAGDSRIFRWEVEGEIEPISIDETAYCSQMHAIAFSKEGLRAFSCDKRIGVQQTSGKRRLEWLYGHQKPIRDLVFSPGGRHLVSASDDRTLRVWDIPEAMVSDAGGALTGIHFVEPIVLDGHQEKVTALTYSPDGEYVFSASGDQSIRRWPMNRLDSAFRVWRGHCDQVWDVAFTSDGRSVAGSGMCGSANRPTVLQWDVEHDNTAEPTTTYLGLESPSPAIGFSPDGKWLAASENSDGKVRIWDTDNPEAPKLTLSAHTRPVTALAFGPENKWLATASRDKSVRLWAVDEEGMPAKPPLRGHKGAVLAVVFSPDGKWLATGGSDKTVRLWSIEEMWRKPQIIDDFDTPIQALSFSPNGKWLAAAGLDGTLRMWKAGDRDARPISFKGHEAPVYDATFSPDSRWLVSASQDLTIRLWDLQALAAEASGKPQALVDSIVFEGHRDGIRGVAFNKHGGLLASAGGGGDGTLRLWLVRPDALVKTLCQSIERNLTWTEWKEYISPELPYEPACPNLAIPPSVFQAVEKGETTIVSRKTE